MGTVSTTKSSADAGRVYRHQKTKGCLPKGAPLPDVFVPENDEITAECAYESATKYEREDCIVDATEFYERAIGALRRTKGSYNKKLAKAIVSKYASLLRKHQLTGKAEDIEREFLLDRK